MKKWYSIFVIERPWIKKLVLGFWIFFIFILVLFPLYIQSVNADWMGLYGGMPSLRSLENPENDLSSELISSDGVSLGRYYRHNRSQVTYEEVSEDLINTLLISEDHRYFDHSGMDFIAYLRVFKGLITFSPAGGGSTITQQLAKNLYQTRGSELEGKLGRNNNILRLIVGKTKEWIIAVYLEKHFTKQEILAMYLNTADFGSNAFGIKVATETFFDNTPDSLDYMESAVLIGILQGSTRFNPVLNYDNSLRKRNEVLTKLYRHGYKIDSREMLDSLMALPIDLDNYNVANHNKGLATYFRSVIRQDLMDWCKENGIDLWESGLKIHVTLDSRMQELAEQAMEAQMKGLQESFYDHWKGRNPWIDLDGKEIKNFVESRFRQSERYRELVRKYGKDHDSIRIVMTTPRPMTVFSWNGEIDTVLSPLDSIKYFKHFLHAGLMAMDPRNGAVKAWVGGINHKYFKYDHVRQGKRQPGSTFKAFVYGSAIENGYPPCYKLLDVSPSIPIPGGIWYPKNADGKEGSGEEMTIRQAMARSVNTITAQLMQKVGVNNVVDFAHRVGIESHLDAVPSLALGTSDVSLYELVGAYSTFVNQGIHTRPYFITRIEDKNGNVIENFVPKTREAISEQTAYKMVFMLMGGVEESGGTSRGLSYDLKEENEIGGKTGTTDNASDGWYMGVTPNLVTGIWVGGDERSIHFRNWALGSGGRTARPIWESFMRAVYANKDLEHGKSTFKRPARGVDVSLDCSRYTMGAPSDSTQVAPTREWDFSEAQ